MIGLQTLVEDFATGMRLADKKAPVSTSQRSKRTFRPGIGPHSEEQTIEMTMIELAAGNPPSTRNMDWEFRIQMAQDKNAI